jgi:hypothetical protein
VIRNCAATGGHLVDTDRDAYIVQGGTYRHVWCTDPTGRDHVLHTTEDTTAPTPEEREAL